MIIDKLEFLFSQQKDLSILTNEENSRYPKTKVGRINVLSTAIIHEAVELQRLTDWKWWKKFQELNEPEAKEELIDIWHFVIQASIELEMGPENIIKEYMKKNKENLLRQEKGY